MKSFETQNHLNAVSRSFAFCLLELKQPLRNWVSIAYLLCRVADTIEDSAWPDSEKQRDCFEKFKIFLNQNLESHNYTLWVQSFPDNIPPEEKKLLLDFELLMNEYNQLPAQVGKIISKQIHNMLRGMSYFCSQKTNTELHLLNLNQVNQYCFFVAGVVGEMLTELFHADLQQFEVSDVKLKNAYHFGHFLQKINLLKDQIKDEQEGRFFIPSQKQIFKSLIVDSRYAFDYLLSIPASRTDVRIFCAWSFYLGLASLPFILKTWERNKFTKIPRATTMVLLTKVKLIISNDEKLTQLYNDLLVPLNSYTEHSHPSQIKPPNWFLSAYSGKLNSENLKNILN